MGTDDVFVEQAEHDAAELGVAIFLEVLESEGAGNDFAAGIGFTLGLFFAGFESLHLGVELIAFFLQDVEAVGGIAARHRSVVIRSDSMMVA